MDFDQLFSSVRQEAGRDDDNVTALALAVEAALEVEYGWQADWRSCSLVRFKSARVYEVIVDALATAVAQSPDPDSEELRQLATYVADAFRHNLNRRTRAFLERQPPPFPPRATPPPPLPPVAAVPVDLPLPVKRSRRRAAQS